VGKLSREAQAFTHAAALLVLRVRAGRMFDAGVVFCDAQSLYHKIYDGHEHERAGLILTSILEIVYQ
jgi:hypothetical protein